MNIYWKELQVRTYSGEKEEEDESLPKKVSADGSLATMIM
jgi:hypothetical protein